jgi:hypothetical protein
MYIRVPSLFSGAQRKKGKKKAEKKVSLALKIFTEKNKHMKIFSKKS